MAFSTTDERWPYLATLVWIATRSRELTEREGRLPSFISAEQSIAEVRNRFTEFRPPTGRGGTLGQARHMLFEKLKIREIYGLATRLRRRHERERWKQRATVTVMDVTPNVIFPPDDDRHLFDRLDHDKDAFEGLSFAEKVEWGESLVDTVDWRDLTFASADVLRWWPELPQTSAYRAAVEIGPASPSPEAKARIVSAIKEPRPSLDEVLALLAPSGDDLVERMRAGHWLLEQAKHGRVKLSGLLAKPSEHVAPLEATGQKQPISESEFDGSALDVSLIHPNAIGASIAVSRYAEYAYHPEAVRWFNVSVDFRSLVEVLDTLLMAEPEKKAPISDEELDGLLREKERETGKNLHVRTWEVGKWPETLGVTKGRYEASLKRVHPDAKQGRPTKSQPSNGRALADRGV